MHIPDMQHSNVTSTKLTHCAAVQLQGTPMHPIWWSLMHAISLLAAQVYSCSILDTGCMLHSWYDYSSLVKPIYQLSMSVGVNR